MSDTYHFGNFSQDFGLPIWQRQKRQSLPMLTVMAREVTPNSEARLYLAEHLEARGESQAQLAAMLDMTPAAVSRWLSADPDKKRRPSFRTIRTIEARWGLRENALFSPPSNLTKQELLFGLSPDAQRDALNYIGYLRQRERERAGDH